MPGWLSLAKSPIFIFVMTYVMLGLLRLVFLTTWDIVAAIRRSGGQRLPYLQIALQTVSALFPFNKISYNRVGYSIASMSFHLSILLVSFFLRNHLDILEANLGISWMPVAKPVLDILTLAGILGIGFLLLHRIYVHNSRRLSKAADYLLLLFLLNIFISGYVAGKPWNPFPYNSLMLFHTLNGMIFLLLIPFTKIAHCVLFPLIRLATETAWHFTPQGGKKTVQSLHGSEGRSI